MSERGDFKKYFLSPLTPFSRVYVYIIPFSAAGGGYGNKKRDGLRPRINKTAKVGIEEATIGFVSIYFIE